MNEKKYLIKSKKQMFLVIGVFALILLLGTTSYAFFNYTRAGSDNSIGTGRINFVSTQSGTTSISNYFPQIPGGAQASQSSLATITVTGGTTFSGGITYYVKLIDVKVGNNAYNSETDVPVYVDVAEVSGLTVANRGTFTPEGTNHSGVGIALSEGVVIANGTIGVADTAANSDNWINGTFTVQAYIPSNVAISDTTGESESTAYVNGTTTEWVNNRRVLTTAQWNALSTNPVTFKIQVVANEGVWVDAPAIPIVPTIDSCTGCKFVFPSSEYKYYHYALSYDPALDEDVPASTISDIVANGDTLYDNYTLLNKDYFLGLKFNESTNVLEKAYVCGIKDYGTNHEIPFCLEGVGGDDYGGNETVRANVYNSNSTLLNDSTTGLWLGECDVESANGWTETSCYAIDNDLTAVATTYGNVYVNVNNNQCDVSEYGYAYCH